MKKFLLALTFVGASCAAFAQTETPVMKHSVATNGLWSNWFVTVGGSFNANYSSQSLNLPGSPFEDFRRNGGVEVTLGKWWSPVLGTRIKAAGVWSKQVNGIDVPAECPTQYVWELSLQGMLNLNNLFCGYKPRVWNISPWVGVGVGHVMKHGGAYSPLFQLGLYNQFNLCKRVFLGLDIYGQLAADGAYDGNPIRANGNGLTRGRDCKVGAALSLGVNIGKTGWEKTPDVAAINALNAAQLAALNEALAAQEAENARLKALLAKPLPAVTTTKTVREVNATPVSVFFRTESANIASKKDLVTVQALVENAKANNQKIVVAGYADSKTGAASYNQSLSQKRAETVAKAIEAMGVARENIEIVANGGVDAIAPYSYNRRVIVTTK